MSPPLDVSADEKRAVEDRKQAEGTYHSIPTYPTPSHHHPFPYLSPLPPIPLLAPPSEERARAAAELAAKVAAEEKAGDEYLFGMGWV